jgi:hypothetical protein
MEHTKRGCKNLDKVYDLPKRRRGRPENSRNIKRYKRHSVNLQVSSLFYLKNITLIQKEILT